MVLPRTFYGFRLCFFPFRSFCGFCRFSYFGGLNQRNFFLDFYFEFAIFLYMKDNTIEDLFYEYHSKCLIH